MEREIQTARLTMRPPALTDFEDSAAMWADPAVTRFIGGVPSTPEEAWQRLLRYAGHWALVGYGYWIVRETESGRFVGEVGFAQFRRAIAPALHLAPELGWALASAAQGKGYAAEAVATALDWSDRAWGAASTVCIVNPDNAASLRVAARAGFVEIARTAYKEAPVVIFERRGAAPARALGAAHDPDRPI